MPKKSRKKPKVHSDARGHYVWESIFIRGKQVRHKLRVTVIDGEIIDDLDEWLLANAGDDVLHQMERWDLIDMRQADHDPPSTDKTMKPAPRTLRLNIDDLEAVFEMATAENVFNDDPCMSFLDLRTGEVVHAEGEEEIDELFGNGGCLSLAEDIFECLSYGLLDDFVRTLPDDALRAKLERAISGKGAFRRFKEIVFGGGNVELKHRWSWYETCRKRERIVEWLREQNIEPDWGGDIFEAPPLPDKRADLLRAVLDFTHKARALPGVRRIALVGSLVTAKPIPKDVDLLVEVDDDMPLDRLARISRSLSGATMATGDGCGADVFVCNPQGNYLGRICSWKRCAPGIRAACQAQHCGQREYLYDDLQVVCLDQALITSPPLDLWPKVVVRAEIPDDVQKELIAHLR